MNVTKSQIDELNATLTVEITEEDYKEKVDQTLSDYRRNANIPGFRKGKVPSSLIRKQYGKAVLIDEINKLLQSSVSEYITSEKLDILGNPLPVPNDDIDWDNGTSFSFDFELGMAPQFEVKFPARKKFNKYTVKATDEVIDEQINNLAKRYGKMVTPDKAEEEDMFSGSFVEVDEEGNEVANGIAKEGAYFIVNAIDKKTVRNKILKAAVGDDLQIKAADFKKGYDVANLLGTDQHHLEDHSTGIFRFTVTHISRIEPAEINQELFDKIFGEGKVKDEAEFRAKVTEDIEKMYTRDAEQQFMNEISEYLMDNVSIDLPESFLKKWMRNSGENPLSEEEVDQQYPDMSKGLKWQLIENKIIKENELNVQYEELKDFAKELLRDQFRQYGMEPDEDQVEQSTNTMLQNQEEAQKISDRLYDEKLKAHFSATLKINEKEVSYDEFVKLVSKQ